MIESETVTNIHGSKWPFPVNLRTARFISAFGGGIARIWLNVFNTIRVFGPHDVLLKALRTKKPVLTFANHVSNVDDPCIWASIPMLEYMNPFKKGLGRILADTIHEEVLLIPVFHIGMDDVMPMGKPYFPRIGKRVTVLYGDPIKYGHILGKLKSEDASEETKRKVLTDLCQEKLYELRTRAKKLHYDWTGIQK